MFTLNVALKRCRVKNNFSTCTLKFKKIKPENLKNKSVSSQHWITRQLSDPYVDRARTLNYRCRSAFKLIEIDDKYKFLRPGDIVVDCGASPGSWTQVAVKRTNSNASQKSEIVGKVFSIDKQQIYPIEGATIFGNMDFTKKSSQEMLFNHLNNTRVDAVISDMAPSASGVRDLDNENMLNLCYSVLRFSLLVSKQGGALLVKLWQCGQSKQLESDIAKYYKNVKFVKPDSSRADSAEVFILARDFVGLKNK